MSDLNNITAADALTLFTEFQMVVSIADLLVMILAFSGEII
jgi:hypothetical protein